MRSLCEGMGASGASAPFSDPRTNCRAPIDCASRLNMVHTCKSKAYFETWFHKLEHLSDRLADDRWIPNSHKDAGRTLATSVFLPPPSYVLRLSPASQMTAPRACVEDRSQDATHAHCSPAQCDPRRPGTFLAIGLRFVSSTFPRADPQPLWAPRACPRTIWLFPEKARLLPNAADPHKRSCPVRPRRAALARRAPHCTNVERAWTLPSCCPRWLLTPCPPRPTVRPAS
ncbi:hypothetical protein C8Q78DRAFT_466282 [Trametes maxima]|nr:hypothetical protein C8Q78DRAFT_466282 [Trametes maxima]